MTKDETALIRINGEIKKRLKQMGLSPQSLIDDAIKKLFEVTYEIKTKSDSKKK
jgi:hypothetical protein